MSEAKVYEFNCVMLNVNFPKFKKIQETIDLDDLYEDDTDQYGLVKNPHVTVLYGLHEEVTSDQVKESISGILNNNVTIKASGISIFESENYDVLKFDINASKGSALFKANEALKAHPYTTEFENYHPHLTIAYLKKGIAEKYLYDPVNEAEEYAILQTYISNIDIRPAALVYSKTDGKTETIHL